MTRHQTTGQRFVSGYGAKLKDMRLGSRFAAMLSALSVALPSFIGATAAFSPETAFAQSGRKLPLVRDAEAEDLLRSYAQPIFKVAGLGNSQIDIILVNDKAFNAFVPDSHRMFINLGVILEAETPGEIIGVIAHESGHIAGRHLVRLREAAANAQIIAVIGMILGAGAAVAGGASGNSSAISGGAAAALSSGNVGQRSMLAYQRGEEAAADRAALKYLEATHQSGKGMLKTFERFAEQQVFSARFVDPYAQSHPMANERYRSLATDVMKSKYYDTPAPAALQHRHDMVRAKILAFSSHPNEVLRRYPRSDKSLPAQYARAIASMKRDGRAAIKEIDALIRQEPSNPYFQELKGQALLESGNPKAAIEPFRRALALKPGEGQFQIWLGYAMVSSNDKSLLPEAETILKQGIRTDPNSGIAYSQLAIAHARQGETAEADLATAKGMMMAGDVDAARRYAARAQKNLKRGTPAWLQADDIVSYKPPKLNGR